MLYLLMQKNFFLIFQEKNSRPRPWQLRIYIEGGVRGVEIGALMADRDPVTRENRFPELEMVRLAIPRSVYTDNHMDYVAAVVKNVFERRNKIKKGLKIKWEAPIMRHFTSQAVKNL